MVSELVTKSISPHDNRSNALLMQNSMFLIIQNMWLVLQNTDTCLQLFLVQISDHIFDRLLTIEFFLNNDNARLTTTLFQNVAWF